MSIAKRYYEARALLRECRAEQRRLLEEAWQDELGARTLSDDESEIFEQLEADAKSLEIEVARLRDELEMAAMTAVAPNSDPDWRPR